AEQFMEIRIRDVLCDRLEVKCYLAPDWKFESLEAAAQGLPAYQLEDRDIDDLYVVLREAACDLDTVVRAQLGVLCPKDVANLWTSLQLFPYFEKFGEMLSANSRGRSSYRARVFLHRPSRPMPTDSSQEETPATSQIGFPNRSKQAHPVNNMLI